MLSRVIGLLWRKSVPQSSHTYSARAVVDNSLYGRITLFINCELKGETAFVQISNRNLRYEPRSLPYTCKLILIDYRENKRKKRDRIYCLVNCACCWAKKVVQAFATFVEKSVTASTVLL